jgi:hypothetical protein
MKNQHENPGIGQKLGEVKEKPAKKYISIQQRGETQKTINFGDN